MMDKKNYKTHCALCGKPIRYCYLFSNNKEYGLNCASTMINGKEKKTITYSIFHKNKKIIGGFESEEIAKSFFEKINKSRKIPISELKIRKYG